MLMEAQDSYRSPFNPYYWKNRMPKPGYWQQDVHYKIDAVLHDDSDMVEGVETLTYYNNSPDTLKSVYFHLYQNAFQPGSYAAKLEEANGVKTTFGNSEAQKKGCVVHSVEINRVLIKPKFDNTIMYFDLPESLNPGASLSFTIHFGTYFDNGSMRRRMKMFKTYGYKHFDCVHWYPRICVYDSKFGWETDQHLGKEFYGDYGSFDVSLNLPSHYVLEATGVLQNEEEVLPADYRKKIDIAAFAKLPKPYVPNACNPADGKRKTWKFHADNVHDFAWTADPLYRLSETTWNGIKCVAIAQEPNCPGWQDVSNFVSKVIACYSRDFGMYAYPKMVAADARDGMEYPMLTLDGGWSPGNHGVIAHEIGHNWFFGMVGSNETYRAALDEGFTQFLTAWSLRRLDGEYPVGSITEYKNGKPVFGGSGNKWVDRFREVNPTIVSNVYMGYLTDAMNQNDEPLNTHSDQFNGALGHGGGYRHVYYKTATMLMNLEYVLGDSLFREAMSHYFNSWKICHPYMEDFRQSVIQFTHVDLNWFFDQWLETTKRNDYSIVSVKKTRVTQPVGDYSHQYIVRVKRKERMQMPLDIVAIDKNGDTSRTNVSNTYFYKKVDQPNTILQYWKGWDNLNDQFDVLVFSKAKLKNVIIDPSRRMSDIYYLNNSWKCPVKFRFDAQVRQPNDLYHYRVYWRPDFWYNAIDGLKAGWHMNGHYMHQRHEFDATIWYNSGIGASGYQSSTDVRKLLNYKFNYSDQMGKNSFWSVGSRYLDGLYMQQAKIEKKTDHGFTWYAEAKTLYRKTLTDAAYALESDWKNGNRNHVIQLGLKGNKLYNWQKTSVQYHIQLRTSALASDYQYAWLRATVLKTRNWNKLVMKARWIGQWGTGQFAPESRLNLAGGNGEEMADNKYFRSVRYSEDMGARYLQQSGNIHFGGGLGLRGYTGYLATESRGATVDTAYFGNSGTALNLELELDQLFGNFRPKLFRKWMHITPYIFGDAGMIWYHAAGVNNAIAGSLRADAGLGMLFSIKKFGKLDQLQPFSLRFDMPLYLSHVPVGQENLAFRYIIGINRAF